MILECVLIFFVMLNAGFLVFAFSKIRLAERDRSALRDWAHEELVKVSPIGVFAPPIVRPKKIFEKKPKVFNPRKDVDYIMSGKVVDPFDGYDDDDKVGDCFD